MCDFDNMPGTESGDLRRSRRWTLHSKNVGSDGNIITHWTSGPGNYTYDADCWWCRLKGFFGFGK